MYAYAHMDSQIFTGACYESSKTPTIEYTGTGPAQDWNPALCGGFAL